MVWIVFHAEVVLQPKTEAVDEMILHLASSRQAAERWIRSIWVDPGSWWRVENGKLDDPERGPAKSRYYSSKGRPLKSAPVKQGYRAAILRDRRALERARGRLAQARREGRSAREQRNLAAAVRSMRRALAGRRP